MQITDKDSTFLSKKQIFIQYLLYFPTDSFSKKEIMAVNMESLHWGAHDRIFRRGSVNQQENKQLF